MGSRNHPETATLQPMEKEAVSHKMEGLASGKSKKLRHHLR